ncbi:Gfo/Idh/MocA family protein [Microlunatus endophyticus]
MSQQATSIGTRELSIGVVGFGMRAGLWRYAHRPDHPTLPSRVTMICDLSERGRADASKALPDAVITDDLDQLLASGVDAVLVTTPDDQHFPVAMKALRAGVAVFCEKPWRSPSRTATPCCRPRWRPAPGSMSATTCGTCRWSARCAS